MHSKSKRDTGKIALLLKQNRKLFHTGDLRLLWGIDNKNTLYSTLARYVNRGILVPVYRGFYSVAPLSELDPLELGSAAIHAYAYLSTESVLAKNGLIFQSIAYHTFCSAKNKRLTIGGHDFLFRQLKDRYLYNDLGITVKNGYREATPERAAADMLYFNPNYHFDSKESIDWKQVEKIKNGVYK